MNLPPLHFSANSTATAGDADSRLNAPSVFDNSGFTVNFQTQGMATGGTSGKANSIKSMLLYTAAAVGAWLVYKKIKG